MGEEATGQLSWDHIINGFIAGLTPQMSYLVIGQ